MTKAKRRRFKAIKLNPYQVEMLGVVIGNAYFDSDEDMYDKLSELAQGRYSAEDFKMLMGSLPLWIPGGGWLLPKAVQDE